MTILNLNYGGAARSEALQDAPAKTISVNGRQYPVTSEPDTPLLFVLRDEIGLTGTKYGCGEGQCGACTVLVDGTARRSCVTPVADVLGKSITTIEGLERNGNLHPVQAAFIQADAFQCAYCTSGMIMSSVALLEKNPHPNDAEIVAGLQGNICRCGAHSRILDAVRLAAKEVQSRRSGNAAVVPALRAVATRPSDPSTLRSSDSVKTSDIPEGAS
jgi:aerobic-type carbon monoxide dehydrogenase small subunit (CoxS/CutS family)